MRFVFIILLACLLSVRGWTGTAMGMQMATAQLVASVQNGHIVMDTPGEKSSTMPADCPMHASEAAASGQPDGSGKACSGCDTCELCLAIASFTAHQFRATPFGHGAAPTAVPHGFISADRAVGLRPPIS